jgi:hypothetical protein
MMDDLLVVPFEQLALTQAFKKQCRQMGFEKLQDILILAPAELVRREGFSYTWLKELTVFLQERGLLHLLQTTPGRIPG